MWETQFSIEYSDYELDEEHGMILCQQTQQLIQNLITRVMKIPGSHRFESDG